MSANSPDKKSEKLSLQNLPCENWRNLTDGLRFLYASKIEAALFDLKCPVGYLRNLGLILWIYDIFGLTTFLHCLAVNWEDNKNAINKYNADQL